MSTIARLLPVLLLGFCATALAGDPLAHVQVNAGPLKLQDSDSQQTSKVVVTGPSGTRTISSTASASDEQLLTTHTSDTTSDVDVSGVKDPGLVVGQKVYMPNGQQIFVPAGQTISTQNGITSVSTVSGGPGSVHSESHTRTTTTPPIRVLFR